MQAHSREESYASSSSRNRKFVSNIEGLSSPSCHCGQALKICTSWTNDNSRRRYWHCGAENGGFVGGCGFVRWFDPPMCARSKMIILGLLRRINRNEEEIERLKLKLRSSGSGEAKYKCSHKCLLSLVVLVVVAFIVSYFGISNPQDGGDLVIRLPLA